MKSASLLHLLWAMKKSLCLTLALTLTLNSFAFAEEVSISDKREEELMELASDNPQEAFAKLTDAELIQVSHDLKILIQDIQRDFAKPDHEKEGRFGYSIREWSKVSIPLAIALTAVGIVLRTKAYKNSPDNPAAFVAIAVLGVGIAAAVNAGGDNTVWLTHEESRIVRERIMRLRKFSLIIDRQLK